jgi:membrane protein YqaA with SNARE-associated domain
MKWLHEFLHHVGRYVSRPWYPLLVGFLAFLDTFIFIIPTDGLLISSVMSAPRRAVSLAFWTTAGSVLGSVLFAVLIDHGVQFAEVTGPAWVHGFFEGWGSWALFAVAALPIVHHPVLVLACIAHTPLAQIALAMLGGRVVKYGTYAWVSTHAPKLLFKFKAIEKEVAEAEKELELPHVEQGPKPGPGDQR